jgi:hypothetical protein
MGAFDDFKNSLGNVFGQLGDAAIATTETADAIWKLGERISDLNSEQQQLLMTMNQQIGINKALITNFVDAAKKTLDLELKNKQLNKSFGINSISAAKLSENLQVVASNLKISSQQSQKYAGSLKKMLPTFNQFAASNTDIYKDLQMSQHVLQTTIGLTEDQSNAYTQYAMQNGDSASSMLKATQAISEALDPDGTMGYTKMITEEIAATGNEIQLQYGKIPGNLEVAVVKAKKLGFALDDLANAGTDLLEIESSIGKELEYQLLSGRRLVDDQGNSLTNLYREAALRGDMNQQADIMNKILEDEGETLENNMFARKQMADMLGMDERKLASALQKKKILDKAFDQGIKIDLDANDSAKALADAAKAVQAGAISEDEFQTLVNASDTRTTDDILKQQLEVQMEQAMYSQLTLSQLSNISANRDQLKVSAQGLNFVDLMDQSEGVAAAVRAKVRTDSLNKMKTTVTGMDYDNYTPDAEVEDAIIPPGLGGVISLPAGTVGFQENDLVKIGTVDKTTPSTNSSDEFSKLIKSIDNQTERLLRALGSSTFSGGINAPYYG